MKYQTLEELKALTDLDVSRLKGEDIEEIKALHGNDAFHKYCTHEGRRKTNFDKLRAENAVKIAQARLALVQDPEKAKTQGITVNVAGDSAKKQEEEGQKLLAKRKEEMEAKEAKEEAKPVELKKVKKETETGE